MEKAYLMSIMGKPVRRTDKEAIDMRFMMLMIPAVYQGPGQSPAAPTPEAIAEMSVYNEALVKAGILLAGDGLHPPEKGARVKFAAGRKPVISDGPFSEAKEVLGGFWMIQVRSKDEAVEWARRCPAGDGDIIEVRRVFEPADFES